MSAESEPVPAGVTGETRVAGVIGDPVRHSLSPVIHNAAFAATGLDWLYVAFPVPAGRGGAAVRAMTDLGIEGLNVTMPHKQAAAAACDDLAPHAARLASVNTVIRRRDGTLVGDSTDGEGFIRSLREEDVAVEGRRALVLGAGGAARAVALALTEAGALVTVAARRVDAAGSAAEVTGASPAGFGGLGDLVADHDVVVNATPVGMDGDAPPFPLSVLHRRHVVIDLVYRPTVTPLLAAAREAGATAVGGLGMLVHQAALSFEAWTGVEAPVAAMRQAVEASLRP